MLSLPDTHDGALQLCTEAPVQARPRVGMFTQKLTGTTRPRWKTRRATGSARQVEGNWPMVMCAPQTLGAAVSAGQTSYSPQRGVMGK